MTTLRFSTDGGKTWRTCQEVYVEVAREGEALMLYKIDGTGYHCETHNDEGDVEREDHATHAEVEDNLCG